MGFPACSVPARDSLVCLVPSWSVLPAPPLRTPPGKSVTRCGCRICCCCCRTRQPLLALSPLWGAGEEPVLLGGSELNLRARSHTEPDLWKGCSRRGSVGKAGRGEREKRDVFVGLGTETSYITAGNPAKLLNRKFRPCRRKCLCLPCHYSYPATSPQSKQAKRKPLLS